MDLIWLHNLLLLTSKPGYPLDIILQRCGFQKDFVEELPC